jgi:hypothetical protein
MLYKGSVHGWNYIDFHSRADNKGPTITFFKVAETGRRCGGFTSISWDTSSSYKSDSTAFVFSLDNKKHFPVKNNDKAIFCRSDFGPTFGDDSDLSAYNEPFNSGDRCRSYSEKPTYMIENDGNGKNGLTGVNGSSFNASEIECFQVVFVPAV